MLYGGGRAVGKNYRSLSQARLACLSVLLVASSCTEPYDSGRPRDGSTVILADASSLDGGTDRADGSVDGAADRPAANLSLDSNAHDFDRVIVNTSSAGATFTLTNNGSARSDAISVMIDAAGAAAGFSL